MFGVLNLNKPAGKSSRDVVNIVQRLAKPHKVGHAGTLDPLATGVLITCVGPATRLISYAQQLPKQYRGTFRLGQSSPTEDIEGEITHLSDAPIPDSEQLKTTLPQFVGQILQTPPAYSALKIKGERAYKLARRGEQVEMKSRPVLIEAVDVVRYEYPELVLDIRCGSGTYIRSLGRDIARSLGTEAVMAALCRTAIGPFTVEQAVKPTELNPQELSQQLSSAASLLKHLPTVELDQAEIDSIATGRKIEDRFSQEGTEFVAYASDGTLLAVLHHDESGRLRTKINFVARN